MHARAFAFFEKCGIQWRREYILDEGVFSGEPAYWHESRCVDVAPLRVIDIVSDMKPNDTPPNEWSSNSPTVNSRSSLHSMATGASATRGGRTITLGAFLRPTASNSSTSGGCSNADPCMFSARGSVTKFATNRRCRGCSRRYL